MSKILRFLPIGLSIFPAVIFLDSLRYKFTDAPETKEIFGRLNDWAGSFGAEGLFSYSGLFSQYVIGGAEFVAASFLLFGLLSRFKRLQGFGALLGLAIMTGAISFHLFTPLGIDPNNDGGGLFIAACIVWLCCLTLVILRRKELIYGLCKIKDALFGAPLAD